MIPSTSVIRDGLRDLMGAAHCIYLAYGGHHGDDRSWYEAATRELGEKIADEVDRWHDIGPGDLSDFWSRVRRVRGFSFVNVEQEQWYTRWYTMMRLRSELWSVIKRRGIHCEAGANR